MNPKQLRAIKENMETIDSLIDSCNAGLSAVEEDLTQDTLSGLVLAYLSVHSGIDVDSLYEGLPQRHSDAIKRSVKTFKERKRELTASVKRKIDSLRDEFGKEYSRLSRQKAPEKEELGRLDSLAESYSRLKSAFDKPNKGVFSGLFSKDNIMMYCQLRKEFEQLDRRIGKVIDDYLEHQPKSKKQFEKILKKLTKLSAEKGKKARKDALLERVYMGDEDALIEELGSIVKNFSRYSKEESNLRGSNTSLKEKLDYVERVSYGGDVADTLRKIDRMQKSEQTAYVFRGTLRFVEALQENTRLLGDLRRLAKEKEDFLVGEILKNVSQTYADVEGALEKSIDSEGYETLIARTKQRILGAKADLDIAAHYMNVREEEKRYRELSAAVDSRILALEGYRQDKHTESRLKEKTLDVEADKIELEKMKLTKRERIRRIDLQAAEAMRKAKEEREKPRSQERVYRPAPPIAPPIRDKDFCNLYCEVERLDKPDNPAIVRLGEIIIEENGRWENMLTTFAEYIKSGKLGSAEGEQNKEYLTEVRRVLKKSIDNGTLTYYAESSPQVKKVANEALESLDNYIAKCCGEVAACEK